MGRESQRYLAIDLGGTFVKYALMDGEATVLEEGKVPTDTSGRESLLATMETLRQEVDGDYAGVAVSMPGRIETAAGIAHTGGSFMWMRDEPIAGELAQVFGRPVTIANDGKCAALAEGWRGALADVRSGCVIVLGTGIGGGIILDGKVLMGSTGAAGELSFLPVGYAALSEATGEPLSVMQSMWAGRVSATAITRAYAQAKGLERADGVMLLDAYEASEQEAIDVMRRFGQDMAAGIFAIQGIIDVPRYAIGGGISARPEVTDIVRDAVDELWQRFPWMPCAKPEITTCAFRNEANLVGALAFHLGVGQ